MVSGISTNWRYHPQRDALLAEAHARPFTPLVGPALVTRIATLSGQAGEQGDRDHMAALCRRLGQAEPGPTARWCGLEAGTWRLRWERHTEFSTWTFFRSPVNKAPFAETALDMVPIDWLGAWPGDVLVATRLEVWSHTDVTAAAALFAVGVTGGRLVDSDTLVLTDFRADAEGMTRFLLLSDDVGDGALTGRLVQTLLEVETYRLMALLAFPVAGESASALSCIEATAADLAHQLAEDADPDADRLLLDRLAAVAGETEALISRTNFRFDAAAAYHRLVRERIERLREQHIEGLLTLGEFMQRRLDPAMRTCDAVAERQRAAIARIARMTQMLNTRVEVAAEATSAALLASMDRRAGAQLRLQQAVEGLSTVAIAYYTLGLLLLPLKGLERIWTQFDATLGAGLLTPFVLAGVWLGLRAWREQFAHEG
ncbi:MAG: hypothetical protein B7Y86_04990 [Brevundimonas subvibrioides]|uniref:Egg lysin n=1 Tax=Brevundimonas subvibrioides TaxID=74313 RepID=A0A258HM18_9CAUL|nr:DUF3422 domain-containing protein [Brevundimonas subvibrioides]OYX57829.1 MAG: hypothetical protein B7Y86_04990 [Brevundimonas subvibrioides]